MKFWLSILYETYIPWTQNIISKNLFDYCRIFIYLSGNIDGRPRVMTRFDLIGKLRYVMEMLVDTIQLGLIAGKKVTISESMIKYFATAVSFIQYLPIKSIKHGI